MGIQAKQIDRIQAAFVRVSGFTASGTSSTVTTAISTALSTAGDGGVSVPVQISTSSGLGIITTGANNRVEIYNAATKDKIASSTGEEVYGRITESSGVYTLTYYSNESGTETSYSFTSTSIDFEFPYRFDFHRLPTDAGISVASRNISNDPSGSSGSAYSEALTVTGTNTISNTTKRPNSADTFKLFVNGVEYDTFGGGSARVSVNISTKAVTWSSSNAGFSIETTDRVIAEYFTYE